MILCSGCPKSFCDGCLRRVLTLKELEEVNDSTKEVGTGMSCKVNNVSKNSLDHLFIDIGKSAVRGKDAERPSTISRGKEKGSGDSDRSTSRGKKGVIQVRILQFQTRRCRTSWNFVDFSTAFRNDFPVASKVGGKVSRRKNSGSSGRNGNVVSSSLPTAANGGAGTVHKKGTRTATGTMPATSLAVAAQLLANEICDPEPTSTKARGNKKVAPSPEYSNYDKSSSRDRKSQRNDVPSKKKALLPVTKDMS